MGTLSNLEFKHLSQGLHTHKKKMAVSAVRPLAMTLWASTSQKISLDHSTSQKISL